MAGLQASAPPPPPINFVAISGPRTQTMHVVTIWKVKACNWANVLLSQVVLKSPRLAATANGWELSSLEAHPVER